MLSALLLAAGLAATEAPSAPSEAHIAAATALISASRSDEMFEQMKDPTLPMVQQTVAQFQGCESAKPVLDDFSKAMAEIKFDDAQIAKVKRDVAIAYTEVFSEAELKEMTAFYESPTGKKMMDRMPEVMQKMQQAQMQGQETMQKMGGVAQSFGPRLEEAFKACKGGSEPAQIQGH